MALVLVFSRAGSSVGFAQYAGAFVRQVRAIETGELGLRNPAGLAYSPTAQTFHVVAARRPAQPPPPETDVVRVTPLEEPAGAARIAAAIWDPVNMVFDSYASRLLVLQPEADKLIEIQERPDGNLDPASLVRHDARSFGLWNPQGMAVDPANGHLFVLDAAGPRIVRIESDPGGAFDGAAISEIDLGGIGLGNVQGLAFDPTSGHLHLLDRTDQQLYELTQAAQVIATRDLSGSGLVEPQGLVFAPSADLTDDPAQMNLYIADSGLVAAQPQGMESASSGAEVGGAAGKILEFSFDEIPMAEAPSFESELVQIIDASAFDPPSPDTAGITYIDATDHLLFSDSEVNEMSIYEGANLFEMTLGGNLLDTGTSTSFSNEPTGVAYNPANGHVFISDDDGKEVYEVTAGDDGIYGTVDDTVTSFDTAAFDSSDPEGITFDRWQGVLFIVDGLNAEVYRVSPGANGLFDGVPPAGDDEVTSFDTSGDGILDPEGITFNSYNGNLFVIGEPIGGIDTVAEFTTSGDLVQTIDISAADPSTAAGLAYAPGSQNPSTRNLYVAARGVDNNSDPNENDGKVYEVTLPPMTNVPPLANDDTADTVIDTPVTINVAANDTDPNSNLDPATANTACSHGSSGCTGAAHGLLTDNGDGTITYDPNLGFSGDDSFVYEICDTEELCDTASVSVTVALSLPEVVEVRVSASEDDAEEAASGLMELTSSDLELVLETSIQTVGMRFNGIDIPEGASITHAYVQFQTDETNNEDPITLTIQGQAADSATTFTASDWDISSRPRTTAAVSWSPVPWTTVGEAGPDQRTPDIASIIQEIVDRPGWASGNSLAIIITGTGKRVAESYDGVAGAAPLLHVEYTTGPANHAPVAVDDAYSTAEDTPLSVTAPGVLDNDTDADGDTLTAVLVDDVGHGTLALNADGSFSYTPEADYNGPDSFTYRANDGSLDSNLATVSLTVTPVNDAPVAVDDAYSTAEDTLLEVAAPGVVGSDSDADGDALTAVLVDNVGHGTLTLNADGSFSYTPEADYSGPDSFTYRANDGVADSNLATVSLTVNAVNDAPVAEDDAYSTAEDTELSVVAPGVLGNDTDVEGDPPSASLVGDVSHGSLTLNADGSFSYTPEADYSGTDSFTYQANDGVADSNVATVSLTVTPVNDAPVAVDDAYSTEEDTLLEVTAPGVLDNDSDVDEDTLTVVLVDDVSSGSLALNADGSFSYTPEAGFVGADSFTYQANDGSLDSNVAMVSLTVTPVNDAPVAVDDAYSTAEDTVLDVAEPGVLDNDTDADGDPLSASLVGDVGHGSLTLNADGSFSYTPEADYSGPDSFTYRANDGLDNSNLATVSLTVTPVNDEPVAEDDAYSTAEDTLLEVPALGVLDNDGDVDGDPLTAVLVGDVSHGSLTLNADGSFSYTPEADYNGPDSFTYRANDGVDNSNLATVSLTVTPVNDAPTAEDDSYTTAEDTELSVTAPGVLDNDSDVEGDPPSASLVGDVSHGSLTLNADGSFSYAPDADYSGTDSFTYQANDGVADSNVATVSLTVTPVNDAPVAVDDAYSTEEDTLLEVTAPGVLDNDGDVDGDTLTVVLVDDVSSGSLALNADGSFSYTPDPGFVGADSFTYQANDGSLDSNVAMVSLTVTPVNDAPVAVDDAYSTAEDTLLEVAAPGVLDNDTDSDGDTLSASLVNDVSHGSLALNADGSFSYTPEADYSGPDSFTYRANDGLDNSNLATVSLTVTPVNDAPTAEDDAYSAAEDTVLEVPALGVLDNDGDVDGDTLTAVLVDNVGHGTLTLNADGSFSYTPEADYSGPDSFTYRANDGVADSSLATVSLTVNAVNDAPTGEDDSYTTAEDTLLEVPALGVLSNDTDADGDTLSASLVDDVDHGTLILNADGSFSYNPDPDYGGTDSFTYQASDGVADSNLATVNLTVTPVNDAPVAEDDAYTTAEDTLLEVPALGVLDNDTDVDGDTLTVVLVDDVSHGTLILNADGSLSYNPDPDYGGTDSFTYQASDGVADSSLATVSLTVTPVNDAPVAVDDDYSTAEDTVLEVTAVGVLSNDSDVDGDTLSASLVDDVGHGSLTLNADGSFSYTPEANYSGPDSFTYRASDGSLDSDVATVSLTVTPVNDAPTAEDDAYSTAEDTVLDVAEPGVLDNDSDVEGDTLTAVLIDDVGHGTLTLNADGSFSYTPEADYSGPDSFTYQASDGVADSSLATVSLTVTPVNDAPTAEDDAYSTAEDTELSVTAPGILDNDGDVDGDTLTVVLVDDVSSGSLALNADGSFSYTPEADYSGPDSFTYRASDGVADSNLATVSLTVTPVNDVPTAEDDAYSTAEDTVLDVAEPGVLDNDSDVEGDPLTAVLIDDVGHGSLALNADGSFSYTPEADYSGPDSFTYRANDGQDNSNLATVSLTVTPVDDEPVAEDDAYSTAEETELSVTAPGVLDNDTDADGDTLTASLVGDVGHGSLALDADGSFSYTPEADYSGPDSFTYRASDGVADSNLATVSLTVTPVNDVPTAEDDAYSTAEDTVLEVAAAGVLDNDSDVEGDPLTAVLIDDVGHGSLALNADGSFSYTPEADYSGFDSFTYRANDGLDNSNLATVSLTVTPVDDAPVAVDDAYSTAEDKPLSVTAPGVLGNDSDAEEDTLTASLVGDVGHGSLALDADGSFSYTPETDYSGPDSFTYRASDGSLDSNLATVNLTVNAVNDAPTAEDDAYSTAEDTVLEVAAAGVLDNDSDVEGDTLTALLIDDVNHGTLTLNANGSFSYTPEANYVGPDSFTYRANDGVADSDPATVSLTVTPVNDAPTAVDDAYSTAEDKPLSVSVPGVLGNDSDADGDTLTASLVNDVGHGTLSLNAGGSFSYTPEADYSGPDSFTYRANDGLDNSNLATVSLTVTPVNDEPVAEDDAYSTAEDTPLSVSVPGILSNDSDVEGDTLSATLIDDVNHGTLSLNADGSFSYTPEADYGGPDSFTYRASDGLDNSNLATVSLTVTPVNDAPVAEDDAHSIAEDTPLSVTAPGVLDNDSDVDGDTLTVVLVDDVSNGSLALNAGGSFSYTPEADYSGPDSFTYRASDGSLDSNPATVSLTVTPVNDAPLVTISAPADGASYEAEETIAFTASATDAEDGDVTTSLAWVSSLEGSIGSGASFSRSDLSPGTHTITATATDSGELTGTDEVTITVNPANNPPHTPGSPSPPDGATGVSSDADLSWTGGDPDPGQSVTYDVYLAAGDPTPDVLICDETPAPACDPGTLSNGMHYYWYVVATDSRSASTTSPTWDFTTICPLPGTPVLAAPADGSTTEDTTPHFDWSPVSTATSYHIQVDDNGDFSSPEFDTTTSTSDYVPTSPLSLGTQYWRVQAVNPCGTSDWSQPSTLTLVTRIYLPIMLHNMSN